jgi:type II secretory pathway component PulL
VKHSTTALTQIGHVLQDILEARDQLAARKTVFGAVIAGAAIVILIPWLLLLVLAWNLARTLKALNAPHQSSFAPIEVGAAESRSSTERGMT